MHIRNEVDGEQYLTQEILIAMHIFGHNAEHKIDCTCHRGALYNFWHAGDGLFKLFHIGTVRERKFNSDKNFKIEAEFRAI